MHFQIAGKKVITFLLGLLSWTCFFTSVFYTSALAQEVLHFSDSRLEAAVRQALGRPTGILTSTDLARLETLEAPRQNITNLSGLEYAVNLQKLNLYQNKVEDLTGLAGLTRLRFLNLAGNCIGDISPLGNLTALEELNLSHNKILTIDALKNLPQMRALHLEGNNISILTPLFSLKNLESLSLSGNLNDKNVVPIGQLTRLQRLSLTRGRIEDLTFLTKLKQLQWLELDNNRISNVGPLKGLTQLESLSLSNNRVEDLTPLGGLRQLQHLDLNNNRVSTITPLVRLRSIKWLELQNNFLELAEGRGARRDIDNLAKNNVEVITEPQKLPLYSGNGLVFAEAGSGGKLLRTPPGHYFTVLNSFAGWRIKSFSVAHEGGKPLDRLSEIGFRTAPSTNMSWFSLSGGVLVNKKDTIFYNTNYRQPGPVQLGLAIQLWPGYADDSARSFYISQVVLENTETGDLYTVELERDAPLQGNMEAAGMSSISSRQDYQVQATAQSEAELEQILLEALHQRVSSLEIRYSGEEFPMPETLEMMLDKIFAGDDYLRYSQKSHRIGWVRQPGGDLLLNLRFNYLATQGEEKIVDQQVAHILRTILAPGMDDHQKTRAVHDYVVANVAYDLNYRDHSAYAALVKGRAVCQGYALLMYKMLKEAGVEARIIAGRAGGENHAWNMVNLGGSWYHLDATWNDPPPDVPGRIRYDFYNRTDAQMTATHTWEQAQYPAAITPYPVENLF